MICCEEIECLVKVVCGFWCKLMFEVIYEIVNDCCFEVDVIGFW